MKINAQYVLQEPPYGDATQPDSQDFILEVAGDRLLGEAYLPSGLYDGAPSSRYCLPRHSRHQ